MTHYNTTITNQHGAFPSMSDQEIASTLGMSSSSSVSAATRALLSQSDPTPTRDLRETLVRVMATREPEPAPADHTTATDTKGDSPEHFMLLPIELKNTVFDYLSKGDQEQLLREGISSLCTTTPDEYQEHFIMSLLQCQKNTYSLLQQMVHQNSSAYEFLIPRFQELTEYWFNKKSLMTQLFCIAAQARHFQVCGLILSTTTTLLDPNFRIIDVDNYTPLIFVANNKWKQMTIALLFMGAKLGAMDKKGTLAIEHILNNFPNNSDAADILSQVTPRAICEPDCQNKPLLARMADKGLPCGLIAPHIKTVLTAYGIPQELCTPTTSLKSIRDHIRSTAYISSSQITLDQKQQAILLLFGDPDVVTFRDLLPVEINPRHMSPQVTGLRYEKELPENYDLSENLDAILTFALPLWPDDFTMQDDESRITKTALVALMRRSMHNIQAATFGTVLTIHDQQILRNMYGNIFLEINKQINNLPNLSAQQQQDCTTSIRRFIQIMGIPFRHCIARIISDSIQFCEKFVKQEKIIVEQATQLSLTTIINQELAALRRDIMKKIYADMNNNERFFLPQIVTHTLNEEFGLAAISFDTGIAVFARVDHATTLQTARQLFYEAYTPVRIAIHLNSLIRNSLQEQAKSTSAFSWHARILSFLKETSPKTDLHTVFDSSSNELTPQGAKLLLNHLGICKPCFT